MAIIVLIGFAKWFISRNDKKKKNVTKVPSRHA
jgi:hypothetical protein